MQRNYLSLAQSRAWGLDYPIGDPFGGAPYGQRAMPVVAVAAAAMSISAGVGMLTAGTAILGSTMLGTVVAGSLIAGGALSIVGTVTGNKKLSKIGNTLQLVGGVSAFAAGATGTMTATTGSAGYTPMTSSEIAAGKGAEMTLADATKVGMDKIATGFDSQFGTNIGTNSWTHGAAEGLAGRVDSAMAAQGVGVPGSSFVPPAPVSGVGAATGATPPVAPGVSNAAAPLAGSPTPVPATGVPATGVPGSTAVLKAGDVGMNADQFKVFHALGGGPDAYTAVMSAGAKGMDTATKMMLGGMALQAGGAMMSAKAAEKAQAYQATQDEATRANINSQIIMANSVEEFKRLEAEGAAVMYFPALRMEAPASPAKTPTTNVWNWNVAATTPVTPTSNSAVLGTVNTGQAVLPA